MKRFYSPVVAACAVGILVSNLESSSAASRFKLGRARDAERSPAIIAPGAADQAGFDTAAVTPPVQAPKDYPRYRLIDLGTLGGASSFAPELTVLLNNRGEMAAASGTATPDPFPDTPLQDGTIWHAILSNTNGVVRDLGGINGNNSLPIWMSENGLIAGLGENGLIDSAADFPQLRALFWDAKRQLFDLGTLGGNTSQAESVNTRGQVVGQSTIAAPENPDVATYFNAFVPAAQQVHGFLWEKGAMRDLGTLGGNNSTAVAINENGMIAGFSATDNVINDATGLPAIHPFLHSRGIMRDLGTLGGSLAIPGSYAIGPYGRVINERGQLAGTSFLAGDNAWHAFLATDGRMIDLGTLGGNISEALALNDAGQVVGRARTTNAAASRRPFLWDNGQMYDLGLAAPCTRGTAFSINNNGQVVGGFGGCTNDPSQVGFERAFFWQKGSPIVLLDALVTPPSELVIETAVGINERGEISATALRPDGTSRAVLLVPIAGR